MKHKKTVSPLRKIITFCALIAVVAVLAVSLRYAYLHYMHTAYPLKYSETVKSCAETYGFDPDLIFALIHTESGFNPKAISSAGAIGLMQIIPDTFDWAQQRTLGKVEMDSERLLEPEINILYGTIVLSLLREMFENESTMLAAYNAGMGNVSRWLADSKYSDDGKTLKSIPYPETARYIEKIPNAVKIYKKLY